MAEGDQQRSEDLAVVLTDLALRIERLKQLYEQYFMGIERMEPQVARKEVTRTMLGLQQNYIRNTALRFRFNMMLQKWSSYTTYWNRTLREIENGTYVRHLQKAARAAAEKGRALPSEMHLRNAEQEKAKQADPEPTKTEPVPSPTQKLPAVPVAPAGAKPPPLPGAKPPGTPTQKLPPVPLAAGAKPPPVPSAARPTPAIGTPIVPAAATAKSPVPGMSEADLRALHKKYQDARTASGDAAPVRYESLVASLAKQVPKVLEQPGVRGVKFDVSVKDGKAILKAIPTK